MTDYLFDFFEETEEVEVDTATIPLPSWEPPSRNIITLDDLDDLDDELPAYDYTRENFDRSQMDRFHEKSSISLRGYQNEATQSVFSEWMKGNWSTLVLMATATGKTFVIAAIAKQYQEKFGLRPDGFPRRGLVLAHRDYLLDQIANAMAAFGVDCAIEQGDRDARAGLIGEPEVVIASVQSMHQKRLNERWAKDHFDYIVTDEGHHGPAVTYRKVYSHFRPYCAHRVFLTATPRRSDDETLEDLCHSRAFVFDIKDAALHQPPCICTDIRVAYCDTKIDISKIRTTKKDLNIDDIAEAIKPYVEQIARAVKKEVGDRTFVGFWPDVGCSQAINSALISLGINCAHLDATSKNQRVVLDGFRQGLHQGLNNCAKFGEGFDLPDVSCVILGRPVSEKAEGLYKQMVGRGLRRKTGKHKDLLLIDFPWVAGKHSLIRPADIFKGNVGQDEVFDQVAADLETEGGTDDLLAAITKADQVVRERREFAIKARDGKVKYTRMEFDPLGIHSDQDQKFSQESDRPFRQPLSDKQIAILERNGIEGIEGMSRRRASLLISKIIARIEGGLASFKQIKAMKKLGVDAKVARSVSFEEASAIISKLSGRR
jgi:superfamily II DNA or RNA helicase